MHEETKRQSAEDVSMSQLEVVLNLWYVMDERTTAIYRLC